MNKVLTIIFILSCTWLYGQEDVVYDNEEETSETENRSNSDVELKERFFFGVSNSYYIDFISSPLGESVVLNNYETDPITGETVPIYRPNASRTVYSSFFSIGVEPRFNLLEMNENLAVAVAVPLALGFGNAGPGADAVGGSGFGHIQIPVMARLYLGANSTRKAEDDFGINVGGGFEMNKIGLFQLNGTEQDREINKAWVMPAVALGVHFYRGYSPMEVNLKYGFGAIQDQYLDEFGNALSAKRVVRANSLKLSIVYTINN